MLGQGLMQTLALQRHGAGVLGRAFGDDAQFAHRQTHGVQSHPVAGHGDQGGGLFLAQHDIGGQQLVLVIQTQTAGVGQQLIRLTGQGRNHRHHLPACADVAVDFAGDGGGLRGVAQDRRTELQHHHIGGGGERCDRFRLIGDEGERGGHGRFLKAGSGRISGEVGGGFGPIKNPPGGPGG